MVEKPEPERLVERVVRGAQERIGILKIPGHSSLLVLVLSQSHQGMLFSQMLMVWTEEFNIKKVARKLDLVELGSRT